MTATDMSRFMDSLVSEARSSRDAAFNALDAVERESRRNTARLAAQVDRYVTVHENSMAQLLRTEVPRLEAEQERRERAAAESSRTGPTQSSSADGVDGREPARRADPRDTRFDPEEW